jgi:Zn-finger nucleic acid-binding protein
MNCPLCADVALEATFSHGIEIDVCPNCKGLWLDRGELERLLTTAEAPAPPPPPTSVPASKPAAESRSKSESGKKKKKKKKKGWADLLEDVFDDVLDL